MGKKIWKLFCALFGTFGPWGYVGALLVSAFVCIRLVWEQLEWSQRVVVSIGAVGLTLFAWRQGFEFLGWAKMNWKRSFAIVYLGPEEDAGPVLAAPAFWYRIFVRSTRQSDVKSVRCKIGEIVPLGDCDSAVARKLDALCPDLRRTDDQHFGQPIYLHAGEPVEFDLLVTQGGVWNVCNADPDFALPQGRYAIRVEVFGEESKPASKWFIARPDAFGHGELILDEAQRGFSPHRRDKLPTKPDMLKVAEVALLSQVEKLKRELDPLPIAEFALPANATWSIKPGRHDGPVHGISVRWPDGFNCATARAVIDPRDAIDATKKLTLVLKQAFDKLSEHHHASDVSWSGGENGRNAAEAHINYELVQRTRPDYHPLSVLAHLELPQPLRIGVYIEFSNVEPPQTNLPSTKALPSPQQPSPE